MTDKELVRAQKALPSADLSPWAAASPAVPLGTHCLSFSAWRATVQKPLVISDLDRVCTLGDSLLGDT